MSWIPSPPRFLTIQSRITDWTLVEVTGREVVSSGFCFELRLVSPRSTIRSDAVLGELITITISPPEQAPRTIQGYVTSFIHEDIHHERLWGYRLQIEPWFYVWRHEQLSRTFCQQQAIEIVEGIQSRIETVYYRRSLSLTHPVRDIWVQYEESTAAFIDRILAREGIYYYVEQSQKANGIGLTHRLVFSDYSKASTCCASGLTLDASGQRLASVQQLNEYYQQGITNIGQRSYNAHTATVTEGLSAHQKTGHPRSYFYGDNHNAPIHAQREANQRVQATAHLRHGYEGESTVLSLQAGHHFSMQPTGLSTTTAGYFITEIHHHAIDYSHEVYESAEKPSASQHYENTFECVPREQLYAPAMTTPAPCFQGVDKARVVAYGERALSTDDLGLVKVRYPWDSNYQEDWSSVTEGDQQHSGNWVRVGQSMAGSGWGHQFIPRAGDSVLIQYCDGDMERPVIVGSVHDDDHRPVFPQPEQRYTTGIKTHTLGSKHKDDGNVVALDDTPNQQHLTLRAQGAHYCHVEGRQETTIGGDATISVQGSQRIEVPQGSYQLEAKECIRLRASGNEILITPDSIKITGSKVDLGSPGEARAFHEMPAAAYRSQAIKPPRTLTTRTLNLSYQQDTGEAMSHYHYRLSLDSGSVITGALDEDGQAELTHFPEEDYTVSYDKEARPMTTKELSAEQAAFVEEHPNHHIYYDDRGDCCVQVTDRGLAGQDITTLYSEPPGINLQRIRHIMVLVPGTTDPLNTRDDLGPAYFETSSALYRELETMTYQSSVLLLHHAFRWNGHNQVDARRHAGRRLMAELYRRLSTKFDERLYFHFIAHSHGGNVLNEFTQAIKGDAGLFSDKWQIRSVSYLSTPFMKLSELPGGSYYHQLDVSRFHAECQITNVVNQYDVTQRVLANYSLKWQQKGLEAYDTDEVIQAQVARITQALSSLQQDGFDGAELLSIGKNWFVDRMMIQPIRLLAVPYRLVESLVSLLEVSRQQTSGDSVFWMRTERVVSQLAEIFSASHTMVAHIHQKAYIGDALGLLLPTYDARERLDRLLGDLLAWATIAKQRLNTELDIAFNEFSFDQLAHSLHLARGKGGVLGLFDIINNLVHYDTQMTDSPLFELMESLFSPHIDVFNNVQTTPEQHLRKTGYGFHNIDILESDSYHSADKSTLYKQFIARLEANQDALEEAYRVRDVPEQARLRREFLGLMAVQLMYSEKQSQALRWFSYDKTIRGGIYAFALLERLSRPLGYTEALSLTADALKRLLKRLNTMMADIKALHIPLSIPEEGDTFSEETLGSLPYFCLTSHNLSRQTLHPDIIERLKHSIKHDKEDPHAPLY